MLKKLILKNLWREDQAYDLVIETSHNTNPIIKGKGSAIFVHCSFSRLVGIQLAVFLLEKKDLILS